MKAFKRIFAAATLLVTTGLASEVNAQVPLEDFFKNPEKVGYQISPDGKYFSYMARELSTLRSQCRRNRT